MKEAEYDGRKGEENLEKAQKLGNGYEPYDVSPQAPGMMSCAARPSIKCVSKVSNRISYSAICVSSQGEPLAFSLVLVLEISISY